MEINLNNNGLSGIGMGRETMGANAIDTGNAAKGVGAERETKNAVTFTDSRKAELVSAEPISDVPDDALSRDDALGKLVNAAFSLPPPPMPAFEQ